MFDNRNVGACIERRVTYVILPELRIDLSILHCFCHIFFSLTDNAHCSFPWFHNRIDLKQKCHQKYFFLLECIVTEHCGNQCNCCFCFEFFFFFFFLFFRGKDKSLFNFVALTKKCQNQSASQMKDKNDNMEWRWLVLMSFQSAQGRLNRSDYHKLFQ